MVALLQDPESLTFRERHALFKQRRILDNPRQNLSRLLVERCEDHIADISVRDFHQDSRFGGLHGRSLPFR